MRKPRGRNRRGRDDLDVRSADETRGAGHLDPNESVYPEFNPKSHVLTLSQLRRHPNVWLWVAVGFMIVGSLFLCIGALLTGARVTDLEQRVEILEER